MVLREMRVECLLTVVGEHGGVMWLRRCGLKGVFQVGVAVDEGHVVGLLLRRAGRCHAAGEGWRHGRFWFVSHAPVGNSSHGRRRGQVGQRLTGSNSKHVCLAAYGIEHFRQTPLFLGGTLRLRLRRWLMVVW